MIKKLLPPYCVTRMWKIASLTCSMKHKYVACGITVVAFNNKIHLTHYAIMTCELSKVTYEISYYMSFHGQFILIVQRNYLTWQIIIKMRLMAKMHMSITFFIRNQCQIFSKEQYNIYYQFNEQGLS